MYLHWHLYMSIDMCINLQYASEIAVFTVFRLSFFFRVTRAGVVRQERLGVKFKAVLDETQKMQHSTAKNAGFCQKISAVGGKAG